MHLVGELDPAAARRKKVKISREESVYEDGGGLIGDVVDPETAESVSLPEVKRFRLCPTDGVLEYRLVKPGSSLVRWVPFMPEVPRVLAVKPTTWQKWQFDDYHEGLLDAHRPKDQTTHMVTRTGYWPTIVRDVDKLCTSCMVCIRFRSTRLARTFEERAGFRRRCGKAALDGCYH